MKAVTDMTLNHLYRETSHWEESVAFWTQLRMTFVEQWGEEPHRAGKLANDRLIILLAETDSDEPSQSVFISTVSLGDIAAKTDTKIVETHWGTTMVSVTDPDGRTYNFEPSGSHG